MSTAAKDIPTPTCSPKSAARLHGAPQAAVVASGMAALADVLLAQCQQGDHVVVSDQLYGRSHALWVDEAARLGIAATIVDTTDLKATAAAFTDRTKLLLVETITNPLLRVADIARLAEIAHARGAKLVVDNTFASPALCRPLELGADLVVESLTKIMNGHSDVLLGLLCGRDDALGASAANAGHVWLHRARRSNAGWRSAASARCTCGSSGPRPMRWPQRGFWPNGRRSRQCIIPACRAIRTMR